MVPYHHILPRASFSITLLTTMHPSYIQCLTMHSTTCKQHCMLLSWDLAVNRLLPGRWPIPLQKTPRRSMIRPQRLNDPTHDIQVKVFLKSIQYTADSATEADFWFRAWTSEHNNLAHFLRSQLPFSVCAVLAVFVWWRCILFASFYSHSCLS